MEVALVMVGSIFGQISKRWNLPKDASVLLQGSQLGDVFAKLQVEVIGCI